MPNHNAKAMRKQANWQAKNAPANAKPISKIRGIRPNNPNDYITQIKIYEKSKSAYELWAKKGDESDMDHKFRISIGHDPWPGDLLLKEKFIQRYNKRLAALKSVEALERVKKICGPGIPDSLGDYFGMRGFRIPRHVRNYIWHAIPELYDYPFDDYGLLIHKTYRPDLQYYEKKPNELTDDEFDAELATEIDNSIRQTYNSFPQNVRRTLDRVLNIKDELDVEWRRRSCMAACRAYKEDLMAETWHPRRVQKILDIGGFELLDHLIPEVVRKKCVPPKPGPSSSIRRS